MKVYKKLIKPMIGFPGQNGEPKRAPIESEEKWYPEEDRENLIIKYGHQESTFVHLIFEEKYVALDALEWQEAIKKRKELIKNEGPHRQG